MTATSFDPDALREKYREERDKRLRTDGNEQYIEIAGDYERYLHDPYVAPLESCTPGYYNNEGKPADRSLQDGSYGAGPVAFIKVLEQWRAAGTMVGLDLTIAT